VAITEVGTKGHPFGLAANETLKGQISAVLLCALSLYAQDPSGHERFHTYVELRSAHVSPYGVQACASWRRARMPTWSLGTTRQVLLFDTNSRICRR
jgi:hypothetical protein